MYDHTNVITIHIILLCVIAKDSDKDLTTWEAYLKEKKQKKKKKAREAKAQESEEETSEIVMIHLYTTMISLCLTIASEEKEKKQTIIIRRR